MNLLTLGLMLVGVIVTDVVAVSLTSNEVRFVLYPAPLLNTRPDPSYQEQIV